jgi:hypothetical protein
MTSCINPASRALVAGNYLYSDRDEEDLLGDLDSPALARGAGSPMMEFFIDALKPGDGDWGLGTQANP